mmetsp:Transcript_147899/g.457334  ORF Transcript_147899/g.457334 Transcript_147899/m.457334 type:complete len:145 (-) Transcript_147899:35-469(-)
MFAYWAGLLHAQSPRDAARTPAEVSARMGLSGVWQVDQAGRAFEHMVYQFHTIVREGFGVVDLTNSLATHEGHSLGERFCTMSEEDRRIYIEKVRPLWVRAGCPDSWDTFEERPLIEFHRDRLHELLVYRCRHRLVDSRECRFL